MGVGKNNFSSDKTEYSTPLSLFEPIGKEFGIETDVCASKENAKAKKYWTKEDDALSKEWVGNCWMNPPFCRDLGKWVRKAHRDAEKFGGTKVCLIPVRSNTKWWGDVAKDAEIRFVIGEVNFNNLPRGIWLPMCIVIFGEKARKGSFGIIPYRSKT